jgi:hypothetical protein
VETIGRLGGAAAAPLGVRPGGVFASAAAQPAGGEAGASLFDSVARSRRMRFRLRRAQSGAAADWQRRSAPGRTKQSGSRGQGALARGDSLLGSGKVAACAAKRLPGVGRPPSVGELEKADFLETRALREAIHAREGGRCFYRLRRMRPMVRCLDHVVARVRGGRNGYRNLVSSCAECNSQKGERRAEDFLRWLWREGRLTAGELSGRLRALARLAAGKLRPALRESARSAQPGLPQPGR